VTSGLEAIFRQGAAALDADDLTGAERLFASIVELEPRSHPAWNALSVVATRSGLPDVALERAKHALEFDRRNPVYLNSLGIACGELGLFADAESAFRRALKAKPAYTEGLFNLGKVLHKQGRLAEAARTYERAYAINRAFPGLLPALIAVYRSQGSTDRALALLREKPAGLQGDDFAELWAACIAEVEGVERAVVWLREQLAQHPQRYGMRFSLAVLLLGQGQWHEGWREYVWRPNLLSTRAAADGRTHAPAGLPDRLDGRSVLLRGEQGIGDVLFFLRFAPLLRQRGAVITLSCERKLTSIVVAQESLECVREATADDERTTQFDFRIWCGDLPALLATDALPPAWTLAVSDAEAAQAKARLSAFGPAPYLGVTWRAGTDILRRREFGNERNLLMKELPPAELGAAIRGWPGTVVALQRGMRPEELAAFGRAVQAPVHDLSALSEDPRALLATLSLLDDYVCVSNTNVHLLAGLCRTARVLVPYPAEWRWGREGDSPWFPGFAVYRQPQSRDWAGPLTELRGALIG
jgi:tetratricopeptide (TPR) repeat protein